MRMNQSWQHAKIISHSNTNGGDRDDIKSISIKAIARNVRRIAATLIARTADDIVDSNSHIDSCKVTVQS